MVETKKQISDFLSKCLKNVEPDDKKVYTYRLTDGSSTFDTRKMTEKDAQWANATCQVATGHKENPWFWEKVN